MNEKQEQFPISLELLRVMFSFVELLGKPNATTISDKSYFHLEWWELNSEELLENKYHILLRFKSGSVIDYVIFKPNPNQKVKKRIILNGSMSPTELIQYLKDNIWY